MKTGEELYCKVYQSLMLPRVTLSLNPQHRKDPPNPDARESDNYESEKRKHRGTCSSNIDFRIPGIPHSTVEQVNINRKETVKRLIEPTVLSTAPPSMLSRSPLELCLARTTCKLPPTIQSHRSHQAAVSDVRTCTRQVLLKIRVVNSEDF